MRYRVIIWGTGREYNTYFNCLKLLELEQQIEVVGVTSNDTNIKKHIDGYKFIPKDGLKSCEIDYCIVALKDISLIYEEALSYGIDKSMLIPIRVLSVPNIKFEKYIRLKKSSVSIISPLCWAGMCYHRLGLEFLSPTINLYINEKDFIKFVRKFDYYISLQVEFLEMRWVEERQIEYPVGLLGDIKIHFNHYETFDQAFKCWERRKRRINRDNIVVVAFSDDEQMVQEFDQIPFENKLIFTSTSVNASSSFHIDEDEQGRLWDPVNGTAIGTRNIIDLIDFLNHETNFSRID